MRHAARSDDCQKSVVAALRAIGCKVYLCKLPVDLLVAVRRKDGRWDTVLLECKDADGTVRGAQKEFIDSWPGALHIVRSPAEAVNAVLGKEAMK